MSNAWKRFATGIGIFEQLFGSLSVWVELVDVDLVVLSFSLSSIRCICFLIELFSSFKHSISCSIVEILSCALLSSRD